MRIRIMTKEYTNDDVLEFLTDECRNKPNLWEEFGKHLLSRTINDDLWDSLSDHLDCFRICDECGRPMIVGYVVDGCDVYCSDECLHKHLTDEEFNYLFDDGNGDTYWTTWYEDSITYNKHK